MIRKEELLRIASFKGLPPPFAELDYMQDIALLVLSREFGSRLVFKGGTCLYKAFGLNRFSEDLDFSAGKGFSHKGFLHKIPYSFGLLNINCRARVQEFQNEINTVLLAQGPLYSGGKESASTIILNVSLRERVALPAKRAPYSSLYPEIPQFELFLMDEREILAEKVRAIFTRNKARDAYDLWFLLKKGAAFDARLAGKKLSNAGLSFGREALLSKIDEKKAGWEKDLQPLVSGSLPPFAQARKEIAGFI